MSVARIAFATVLLLLASCGRSPLPASLPDSRAADAWISTGKIDILVVITVGDKGSSAVLGNYSGWVYRLTQDLLAATASPPISDLHLGVVTSKIDMPEVCVSARERVKHDGRLLAPTVTSKPWEWPESWPWPPRDPYVKADQIREFPPLGSTYTVGAHRATSECSVTQYLESALLAIDGRNPGFVRPDSLLVVALLGDREDCSTKDHTLWERSLWGSRYTDACVRCLEDPPGLLYPVDHYVERFQSLHPGAALFAVVSLDSPVIWRERSGLKSVAGGCSFSQVAPSLRLPAFVKAVQSLGYPSWTAELVPPCPLTSGGGNASADKIAAKILQMMAPR